MPCGQFRLNPKNSQKHASHPLSHCAASMDMSACGFCGNPFHQRSKKWIDPILSQGFQLEYLILVESGGLPKSTVATGLPIDPWQSYPSRCLKKVEPPKFSRNGSDKLSPAGHLTGFTFSTSFSSESAKSLAAWLLSSPRWCWWVGGRSLEMRGPVIFCFATKMREYILLSYLSIYLSVLSYLILSYLIYLALSLSLYLFIYLYTRNQIKLWACHFHPPKWYTPGIVAAHDVFMQWGGESWVCWMQIGWGTLFWSLLFPAWQAPSCTWKDLELWSCHRHGLVGPRSPRFHLPRSQQRQRRSQKSSEHSWAGLGLGSCHHHGLDFPRSPRFRLLKLHKIAAKASDVPQACWMRLVLNKCPMALLLPTNMGLPHVTILLPPAHHN